MKSCFWSIVLGCIEYNIIVNNFSVNSVLIAIINLFLLVIINHLIPSLSV